MYFVLNNVVFVFFAIFQANTGPSTRTLCHRCISGDEIPGSRWVSSRETNSSARTARVDSLIATICRITSSTSVARCQDSAAPTALTGPDTYPMPELTSSENIRTPRDSSSIFSPPKPSEEFLYFYDRFYRFYEKFSFNSGIFKLINGKTESCMICKLNKRTIHDLLDFLLP